jgi:uncharacterized membrane protein YfcA
VTWQLSVTGLLIGMLVGLTGMGGGSLMTPILILVFGFKPTLAVGTDILHGAVFKSFGAVRHRRLGAVHARITFWMLLGSAPLRIGLAAVLTASGVRLLEVPGYALLVCCSSQWSACGDGRAAAAERASAEQPALVS